MIVDKLLYEIGIDTKGVKEGLGTLQAAAYQVDNEFNGMASRWGGVIQGLLSSVVAPVAGAFAIGKIINSYMSDVSEVAKLTGAYNQKLDEWRIKRAQLARVTKEDIELYKQYKEAMTSFNIAIADVSAKLMRSFSPVMKLAVDGLKDFTKWINRNQDNIVRFLLTTAGVLTGVFLPAILKTSAALLLSPLTWLIGALGVLVLVFDDLTTYLRGGKSAFEGFWAIFGTGPEIMAKLTKAFNGFMQILSIIWKPLAIVLGMFAGFKIALVLVGAFAKALFGLKAIMTVLAANPLMVALTVLVSLIVWVTDAFNRAGGEWSKVWSIMDQDVIDFLNIFGGLGDKINEAIEPFKGILHAMSGMLSGLIGVVVNTGKLIWAYLTGGSQKLKDELVNGITSSISQWFESFVNLINGAVELWGKILSGLGSALSSLGELVGKGLLAAFDALVYGVKGVFSLLLDLLLALMRGLSAIVGRFIEGTSDLIGKIATSIGNFLGGIFGSIGQVLGSIFSSIGQALAALVTSITSAFGAMFSATSKAISAAVEAIGSFIGSIGSSIGLAISTAMDAISSLVESAISYISAAWLGLKNSISAVWQDIANSALMAFTAIGDVFSNIWGSIKGSIASLAASAGGVWDNLLGYAQGALKGLSGAFTGAFEKVKSIVGLAVNWIVKIWGKVPENLKFLFPLGLIIENFDTIKAYISDLVGKALELGSKVSAVFDSVTSAIANAFNAGLQAAKNFFDSVLAFFSEIPAKIAQAFDISGMIEGATNKLKNMFGGAADSMKSFFGFGGGEQEEKSAKAQPMLQAFAATKEATQSTLQTVGSAVVANNQALAQAPVTANTSSITNSTYNNNNSRNATNSQQINNTVNINVPNGADARGVVREAQKSFHSLNASNNYVTASEYGNFNT